MDSAELEIDRKEEVQPYRKTDYKPIIIIVYIPYDTEAIKISSTSLSAKRFLKGYDDRSDVFSVPNGREHSITKSRK